MLYILLCFFMLFSGLAVLFYYLQGATHASRRGSDMYSFRRVLLLVAAVLPSASAQSVCQTGWTQAPSTSDWGSKCYREFGPTGRSMLRPHGSDPISGGYTPLACEAACKNDSATGRMLCLTSEAEMTFVVKQAYMTGWVGYTQNSSRSDYAEPAGGWGWECASTYVPTWGVDRDGIQQPDNVGMAQEGMVSCAVLFGDSTVSDQSCIEGDGIASIWARRALLTPTPRSFAQALTTHPAAQTPACVRTTRRHQPPPPAWTGASRPVAS